MCIVTSCVVTYFMCCPSLADQYQEMVPAIMEQRYIERECANVTNIAGLLEQGNISGVQNKIF